VGICFAGCATETASWDTPVEAQEDISSAIPDDIEAPEDLQEEDTAISVEPDIQSEDIVPFVPPSLPKPGQASQLGTGDGSPESVGFTVILSTPWIDQPTDLAFDPQSDNTLWVTNQGDDSFVMIRDPGVPNAQFQSKFIDYYHYFVDGVMALAFSRTSTFATCAEEMGAMNGTRTTPDEGGPVLWSADPEVFETYNDAHPGGAHIDGMHSSPKCRGIAWKEGAKFYALNGVKGHLDLYDFQHPHAPGWGDVSDGKKFRVLSSVFNTEEDSPAHMAMDPDSGWLYIADTGAGRIVRVDTNTGTQGNQIFLNPDEGTSYHQLDGVVAEDWISPESGLVTRPGGLMVAEGYVWVSDLATGVISAFNMDGEWVNSLDTGRGADAVMGLAMGPNGAVYFVDNQEDEVVRIDP